MNSICNPTGTKFNFTINILLHITILFLILSLFFMFYVSKLIKKNLNEELIALINENLTKSFKSLNPEQNIILKQSLKNLPYDNLIKLYSVPDPTVVTYNDWLFKMIIAINIFLFLLVIVLTTTPYIACDKCVPIKNILIENFSIFIFVGMVEFIFFTFIAIKYIPAPPSLMIDAIINGLKKYL